MTVAVNMVLNFINKQLCIIAIVVSIFNDDITGSHDMMVAMATLTSNIEMVRVTPL